MTGKDFVRDKEIIKRMETNEENNSFITIKIHKLLIIHPAEKELRRISKLIFVKINKKINQKFELNQCKNTDGVIDWFEQVKNANLYKFANFEIK